MKRTVFLKRAGDEQKVVTNASTMKGLFEQLDLSEQEFLAARNGVLAVGAEKIKNNDKITIYPVVSGG